MFDKFQECYLLTRKYGGKNKEKEKKKNLLHQKMKGRLVCMCSTETQNRGV